MFKNLLILTACLGGSYLIFGRKKDETVQAADNDLVQDDTFNTMPSEVEKASATFASANDNGKCRIYQMPDGSSHYNAYGTAIPAGATCVAVFK